MSDLKQKLRAAIPIIDGDADIWALFRNPELFDRVFDELARPFEGKVDKILGAESRGFACGLGVALKMGLPFVGVRKEKGFLPGELWTQQGAEDYKGECHTFRLQKSAIQPGDRVLLVDDWIETCRQSKSIKKLACEQAGGVWVGISTVINQTTEEGRQGLGVFHGLITNDELYAGQYQKSYTPKTS